MRLLAICPAARLHPVTTLLRQTSEPTLAAPLPPPSLPPSPASPQIVGTSVPLTGFSSPEWVTLSALWRLGMTGMGIVVNILVITLVFPVTSREVLEEQAASALADIAAAAEDTIISAVPGARAGAGAGSKGLGALKKVAREVVAEAKEVAEELKGGVVELAHLPHAAQGGGGGSRDGGRGTAGSSAPPPQPPGLLARLRRWQWELRAPLGELVQKGELGQQAPPGLGPSFLRMVHHAHEVSRSRGLPSPCLARPARHWPGLRGSLADFAFPLPRLARYDTDAPRSSSLSSNQRLCSMSGGRAGALLSPASFRALALLQPFMRRLPPAAALHAHAGQHDSGGHGAAHPHAALRVLPIPHPPPAVHQGGLPHAGARAGGICPSCTRPLVPHISSLVGRAPARLGKWLLLPTRRRCPASLPLCGQLRPAPPCDVPQCTMHRLPPPALLLLSRPACLCSRPTFYSLWLTPEPLGLTLLPLLPSPLPAVLSQSTLRQLLNVLNSFAASMDAHHMEHVPLLGTFRAESLQTAEQLGGCLRALQAMVQRRLPPAQ